MPSFVSQIIQQHPDAGYWHQQYPWFPIGQLVDAANKKDTLAFTESAQRTAVFFNNIPRLHWLLHQPEVDVAALQALAKLKPSAPQPEIKPSVETETGFIIFEKPAINENVEIATEISVRESAEPELTTETDVAETPVEDSRIAFESDALEYQEDKTSTSFQKTELIEDATEEIIVQPPVDVSTQAPEITDNITGLAFENHQSNQSVSAIAEPEEDDDQTEEPELLPLPTSMLSESLAKAADNFKNAPADDDDTLVFKTAYQHTIDYFASQGIKLDSEPAKDDRFGQQLKTFTSWLRQMKPLPGTPPPETDPLVESQAAHSLQKGEVLTEPMADVLLKQGKQTQAIAVLEKLRLLHPQKSHYFAARIQQIKDF